MKSTCAGDVGERMEAGDAVEGSRPTARAAADETVERSNLDLSVNAPPGDDVFSQS